VKAAASFRSKSGAFWVGCFGIAEGILVLCLLLFVEPQPDTLDYLFARPWLIAVFLMATALLVLAVAWIANRLGLGD
jgi:hypothetical protein